MTTFDNMPAAPIDQPSIDVADLQAKIYVLEEQLKATQDDLEIARGRATTNANNHIRDIDYIGEMLMKEANERDWCAQYDDFVDLLNRDLRHPLPTREQDYEAEITLHITFTARPTDYSAVADDIARALYNYGDNLGSLDFEVSRSEVEDVNPS